MDALRFGCFDGYFEARGKTEKLRQSHRAEIDRYNEQIRAGARWL